jgi:peroxiredoxin family protein
VVSVLMAMDLFGPTWEDMIEGPKEPAGAGTVLAEAQDAILCI